MEEEEDFFNEAEYKRGFNHGAILATYEADLADQLIASGIVLDSEFASGLFHGIHQGIEERESERLAELEEIRGYDTEEEVETSEKEEEERSGQERDIESERMDELDSLREDNLDKDSEREIGE